MKYLKNTCNKKNVKQRKTKGFSLLELVVVIAIIAVLTTIVVGKFRSAQVLKEQQRVVVGITAHLEQQKANSQAGKNGSSHGVQFNEHSYVLFQGSTFDGDDEENKSVELDSKFVLSETITNSDNIIFFSRINGEANQVATVTVSHISGATSPQQIVIEKSGAITVIE